MLFMNTTNISKSNLSSEKGVEYITCTVHKFKSNIAYYMRECEAGRIKGVILKRYDRTVGVYIPYSDQSS